MKCLTSVVLVGCGLVLVSMTAVAQVYPVRPIRIIVPYPSGGGVDTLTRIVAQKLSEQFGRQVVVDNRPGATSIIGLELAKNSPADGYTLTVGGLTALAVLPAFKPNLPYEPERDFIALTRIASTNNLLAVHPSLGVSTVASLVKLAKARPGQLNFGSYGVGSTQHFGGEMFNVLANVKTVLVSYKTGADYDLVSGQLQFMVNNPLVLLPFAKTGRIKVIASTGAKRDTFMPDLPTVSETLPGYEITFWAGVLAPTKTPDDIVARLNTEIVKSLQSSSVREQIAKQGATPHPESPAEFSAFIKAERERITRVGRLINIKLD